MPPSWAASQGLDSGFFILLLTSAGPGQRSGVSWGQEHTYPMVFQDRNWKQHPHQLATHWLRSCHPPGSSDLRCPGTETPFSRENACCPMCAGSAGGKWRSTSLPPDPAHLSGSCRRESWQPGPCLPACRWRPWAPGRVCPFQASIPMVNEHYIK